MGLSVKSYDNRPGGGYAIVEGPGLIGVSGVSIENRYSGLFLNGEGRWTKTRTALPVVSLPERPDALLLGPHIVDFIPTDSQVTLSTDTGQELGRIFWTDIIPSRNPGLVTGDKFVADEVHRREAAERKAREAEEQARREAEEQARREAEEQARREAEEQARRRAEDQARRDAEEQARREAEDRARLEREAQERRDREEAERTQRRSPGRKWLWLAVVPIAAAAWIALETKPSPVRVPDRQETRQEAQRLPPPPPPVAPPAEPPVVAEPVQPPPPPPPPAAPAEVPAPPEPPQPVTRKDTVLVERTSQHASFDCRPGMAEPAAQLICADADLAVADEHLGQVFLQRLNSLSSDAKRSLITDQRVWIGRRNRSCGIPIAGSYDPSSLVTYKPCFLRMIDQRVGELGGG